MRSEALVSPRCSPGKACCLDLAWVLSCLGDNGTGLGSVLNVMHRLDLRYRTEISLFTTTIITLLFVRLFQAFITKLESMNLYHCRVLRRKLDDSDARYVMNIVDYDNYTCHKYS